MVRAFQGATMALKYAEVPVVVAPAGLALGGGCEIVLHARPRAGGGRNLHRPGRSRRRPDSRRAAARRRCWRARWRTVPASADPLPSVQRVFETIGFAQGLDERRRCAAPRLPPRRRRDHDEPRAPDRRRQGARARRAPASTSPPQPRPAIRVGGEGVLAALKLGVHLAWRAGRISDHDALIGRKLAWILAGGDSAASDDGERAAAARSRARSVPQPVRRAKDAGAHRAHAEDRKAAEELMPVCRQMRADVGQRSRSTVDRDPRRAGTMGVDAAGAASAGRGSAATSRTRCAGDIGSDVTRPTPEQGFDNYLRQLDAVFDRTGVDSERALRRVVRRLRRAALRGDAAGAGHRARPRLGAGAGLAAVGQQSRYLARPWLSAPVFVVTSPLRVWPEISAAMPALAAAAPLRVTHGVRVAAAPMIPSRMAARVRAAAAAGLQRRLRAGRARRRWSSPATRASTGRAGRGDAAVPAT